MIASLLGVDESLTLVLAGAKTTVDATYQLIQDTGDSIPGVTNGVTAVVIDTGYLGGPKRYSSIIINNNDTGAITVTMNKKVGSISYPIFSVVMQTLDQLIFNKDGVRLTNSAGQSGAAAVPAQLVGVTAGTTLASKAVVADANKDNTGIRNLTLTGGLREVVTAVAAAGSVIGDAGALAEGINIVSAADDTKGVILPVAVAGMRVTVKSTVSNKILKVWPQTGAAINALTASNAMSLASGPTPAIFIASSATQWYSIPLLPS